MSYYNCTPKILVVVLAAFLIGSLFSTNLLTGVRAQPLTGNQNGTTPTFTQSQFPPRPEWWRCLLGPWPTFPTGDFPCKVLFAQNMSAENLKNFSANAGVIHNENMQGINMMMKRNSQ